MIFLVLQKMNRWEVFTLAIYSSAHDLFYEALDMVYVLLLLQITSCIPQGPLKAPL